VKAFLAEAVNSVLAQTYQNTEVILIDNGSTDGTYDVALSFKDRISVTRFPTNIGGYQAMNEAVKMASGDLIAVYHSDDAYDPSIIEKEVTYLQSHPKAGAVFALENFMDYEGTVFGGADLPREFISYDQVDAVVIGDTVGDPFKDTSSVAMNPVIKFTTLFGLLAVEMAVANPAIRIPVAVVFMLIAMVFVYRSFYGMRISSAGAKA
jgi:glycosyltransferase involved in cell wall biosynthesis